MNNELINELEFRGCTEMPKVLLAAAECAPLAKTGGLADVVGTLPKALAKLGIEARIIVPYHRIIKEKYGDSVSHMLYFYSNLGWRHEYVGLEKLVLDGVTIYLIDSERYFGDKIYRGGYEEGEQYSYFCRAVLDAVPCLDFKPDIIHCNDWHTAMIPMLARTQYCGGVQEKLKFLITIHNIAFQGKYGFDFVGDQLGVDSRYFTPEFMELNGCADYLKAGCVFSDRINTVSPTYSGEIRTSYFGEGLEGILNARSAQLSGIINGIDTDVFNPEKDRLIPAVFSRDSREGKALCKAELQKKAGLEVRPDVPVFAMVTRMTEQKGFDLVSCVIDDLMSRNDMQFMLLGSGDERFENFMRGAESRWKGRLSAYIGYSEEYSHLVYAGADFYLMPSRFEPCGLSQMIAMRYGTVPVVRETGGLKDTVDAYNKYTGTGNGFSFANYDAWEMRDTIIQAISCYKNKEIMDGLIRSAMSCDFSFDRSAFEYGKLYIEMYGDRFKKPLIIEHNASSSEFRNPVGALKCGEKTKLSFKIVSGNIKDPVLVVTDEKSKFELPMTQDDNVCSITLDAAYYPSAIRYVFKFDTPDGTKWLCPDVSGCRSRITDFEAEGFRLTVYNAEFKTPSWFKKSVMYQIFPDSFATSEDKTAQRGIASHKKLGQGAALRSSEDEIAEYEAGQTDYLYYGGTFKGIEGKLSYLHELGIDIIYLNPIFKSSTSNRFDVSDYSKPDPVLGSMTDFKRLCSKAKALGIKIILDGVFSHTGADSIYFNAYGHFGPGGACSGKDNEYYSWYSFSEFPDNYRCWWGIDRYPEVDENNPEWQKFIASGDSSIVKTWMKNGAYGWRINVADEIPDSALQVIYDSIKAANSDAPVIGEVWEDPVLKYSHGIKRNYALGTSCDSFMNYPLRTAILDFAFERTDAYGLRDFLLNQKLNYPAPIYYSMMNLLGSHDVDRIRSALSSGTLPAYSGEALKDSWNSEKLCAFIQFVLPGVPCIYYGDEQGMLGAGVPRNRSLFKVSDDKEYFDYYRDLIAERKNRPELSTGEVQFIACSKDVLAVLRYVSGGSDALGEKAPDGASIAIINRGAEEFSYSIDLSAYGFSNINGSVASKAAVLIPVM